MNVPPDPEPTDRLVLTISALRKSFGPVPVLTDIHFDLRPGEIHALVGENGAGKTTLCRIIAGLLSPDSGVMTLGGRPYAPRQKREAIGLGVRMVFQELNLIGTLTVAESIFIERLPHRWGWIDRQNLEQDARAALRKVGLTDLDPNLPVATLGVGQQQLIEIAAGLSRACRILILDEPSAALTEPEVERLFAQIAKLKSDGTSVIYISHRMEEIQRIADRTSVLRDGCLVATRDTNSLTLDETVQLMVGRKIGKQTIRRQNLPGEIALRVEALSCPPRVRDFSMEVRRGEILGLAGLMGSGRTEAMRLIFGADPKAGGRIYLGGATTPAQIRSPSEAVRRGIALLTENRKEQGLLLPLPIEQNITLPSLARLSHARSWIPNGTDSRESLPWLEKLGVRCRDGAQPVRELSGGNQQKIVIAKWLLRDCDVLIFDEPTRGIDVGARCEIHKQLDELARRGKALVVVSSDLTELMAVSDRIAVMSAGYLIDTFARGEWSQDRIMNAALSRHLASEHAKHE